jgi:hypothetical protein
MFAFATSLQRADFVARGALWQSSLRFDGLAKVIDRGHTSPHRERIEESWTARTELHSGITRRKLVCLSPVVHATVDSS